MNGMQWVILVAVMIPIVSIIMSHLTKMKAMKAQGLSSEAADALTARAARLEDRVIALERILDVESPGWRSRT